MDRITLKNLKKEMESLSDPARAKFSERYFKTGKGEYGEGDVFLGGISTPNVNSFILKYEELSMEDIKKLLESKYHEERSVALGILKKHYEKALKKNDEKEKRDIYEFYLGNTERINNWDLVDVTADKIVGQHLLENPKEIKTLDKLVKSKNLWERRIAVISTFAFIRNGKFEKTLELCEKLLADKEDLMHKATGWMLREIGKRDLGIEKNFLKKHYKTMPRTMLRYAIEKFPESLRQKYLRGEI